MKVYCAGACRPKETTGIGVTHQLRERRLAAHRCDLERGVDVEHVDVPERQRRLPDALGRLTSAFLERGVQQRQHRRIVAEREKGIWPELQLRDTGEGHRLRGAVDSDDQYVVAHQRVAALTQRGRSGGFAGPLPSKERDRATLQLDNARMEHQQTALVEQHAKRWPQDEEPQDAILHTWRRLDRDIAADPNQRRTDTSQRQENLIGRRLQAPDGAAVITSISDAALAQDHVRPALAGDEFWERESRADT